MNLDEAKSLWASDVPTDDPSTPDSTNDMNSQTLSNSEILRLVQEKSQEFEETIRERDLIESVVALVLVAFFGWIAWTSSGLAQIGALVVVAGCIFIPWRMYRSRAQHADLPADCSLADRLHAEREKIETQIDLLRSIAVWYIAPITTGLVIHFIGREGWSWVSLVLILFLFGGSCWIYIINHRAVRRDLRPRHDEITDMIEQIEA